MFGGSVPWLRKRISTLTTGSVPVLKAVAQRWAGVSLSLCSRLLLHKLLLGSHANCDISPWLSKLASLSPLPSPPLSCVTAAFQRNTLKLHVHPLGWALTLTCDSVWSTSVSFLAAVLLPDMNRDGCNGLWTMFLGYTTIDSLDISNISCSIYPFNTYNCTRVELLEVNAK